jgi:type I restriction enzyme, R subunit
MANEADTCRKFVVPKLQAAGWDTEPHSIAEQRTFTDGRIIPLKDGRAKRRTPKRADYLLRYTRDFTLAVVEAKADYSSASDGLQQAKQYAEILGLKFAYSTNGAEIVEFDYLTGRETHLSDFPAPVQLWSRLQASEGIDEAVAERMLTPYHHASGKSPRYYQEIAINRCVQAILQGKSRVLITMATGTGKTVVAFQICWKLWSSRWNRRGAPQRKPRILYLADRNFLVDDPKDKIFAPFGDARFKIENGQVNLGREMYFSIYQAIARDEHRPGLIANIHVTFSISLLSMSAIVAAQRRRATGVKSWSGSVRLFNLG